MADPTYGNGDRVRHARATDAIGTVLYVEDDTVRVKWDDGPTLDQQPHQITPYVRSTKEQVQGLLRYATTPFIAVSTTLLRQIVDDLDLLEEYKVHPLLTQLRREIPNEHTYVPEETPDA